MPQGEGTSGQAKPLPMVRIDRPGEDAQGDRPPLILTMPIDTSARGRRGPKAAFHAEKRRRKAPGFAPTTGEDGPTG